MGFVLVFKPVNKLLNGSLENVGGTGRRVCWWAGNTATATVIGASFGDKGYSTYDTHWRGDRFKLFKTTGAEVHVTGIRYKHFAQVTKGGEKDIEERAQQQLLKSQILVYHQYSQIRKTRFTIYHRSNATDPVRRVTI